MPRPLPLEVRIERAEAQVERCRVQYEQAKAVLLKLKKEQQDASREKVMAAISRSKHTIDEILAFIAEE